MAVNDHIFNREANLQDKVTEGEVFPFEDISFNDLEITLIFAMSRTVCFCDWDKNGLAPVVKDMCNASFLVSSSTNISFFYKYEYRRLEW